MTTGQVTSVELGVIVLQLQLITPTLKTIAAGVAKLLAHFGLDKQAPAPASPESK